MALGVWFRIYELPTGSSLSTVPPPARTAYSIRVSLGAGHATTPTDNPKSARMRVRSQLLCVNAAGPIVFVVNVRDT